MVDSICRKAEVPATAADDVPFNFVTGINLDWASVDMYFTEFDGNGVEELTAAKGFMRSVRSMRGKQLIQSV